MRIRILSCSSLFLIMTGTIITLSVYKYSRDPSTSPPRLHGLVEIKRHQQDYNHITGPAATIKEPDKQNTKKDGNNEFVHVTWNRSFQPLPLSVIKFYVFFVGVARSGHSIVGAVLDSHPHIVISHELNVFRNLLTLPDLTKSM